MKVSWDCYSAKLLCCKPWRYGAPFPLEPKVKRIELYTNGALCRYTSALLLTRELLNSSTVLCTHLSRFADMNSLYIAEPGPGPLDYESNSFIWPLLRSVRSLVFVAKSMAISSTTKQKGTVGIRKYIGRCYKMRSSSICNNYIYI